MFQYRSTEKELMDDLNLSSDALRKNLDELEIINYWLGGNKVITNALNKLLKLGKLKKGCSVKVADLGSGGGDVLRTMAGWFRKKHIPVQLTGIDANAFMIDYAEKKAKNFPEISFTQLDIFSDEFPPEEYDIITCSLFCHHFSNEELKKLFGKLGNSNTTVIINDLHRHWFAYYSIKILTRLFRGSYLVKNDAPLSVLRAFKKEELAQLMTESGISQYQIRWLWAFRYQVVF